MRRLAAALGAPVNAAPLAIFRAYFGFVMFMEAMRFWLHGWIERYFVAPQFLFKYMGFEWVEPMPEAGMYVLFGVLGVAALMVAAGAFFRSAIAVLTTGWLYVFLLEESNYLNHLYFVLLVLTLLAFTDAGRAFSWDARRAPDKRIDVIARWQLALLQFQVGVVYFFGGVAKLEPDWLSGMPLTPWLQGRFAPTDFGGLFHMANTGLVMAWIGLVFDLTIVFVLLNRRTRALGFVAVLIFNLMNAFQFRIGIFPWVMMGALVLFVDPENPRLVGLAGTSGGRGVGGFGRGARLFVGAWVIASCLLPLRHWLYPGWVSWTEEGHRFSWRMKLRDKQSRIKLYAVIKGTGRGKEVEALDYLNPRQYKKMLNSPSRIVRFAKYLKEDFASRGHDVAIYSVVATSLNRRKPQLVFDRDVDLADLELSLWHVDWIRPFEDTPVGELEVFVQESRLETP